jgi:hypothetical protein
MPYFTRVSMKMKGRHIYEFRNFLQLLWAIPIKIKCGKNSGGLFKIMRFVNFRIPMVEDACGGLQPRCRGSGRISGSIPLPFNNPIELKPPRVTSFPDFCSRPKSYSNRSKACAAARCAGGFPLTKI